MKIHKTKAGLNPAILIALLIAVTTSGFTISGIPYFSVASLNLMVSQTGCTDNNDGTYTATYDAEVSWGTGINPGDIIDLERNGVSFGTIDPNAVSSPATLSFSFNTDGNSNQLVTATIDPITCVDSVTFKSPLPCPSGINNCTGASGCLGGNVYEDFNYNGTKDALEPGILGMNVQVFDCTNAQVANVWTDTDGDWEACGLSNGTDYRVEFVMPESIACWAKPTHSGSNNGTDIQFLTAPGCADFSISNPDDYCQADPLLSSACYVNGDGIAGSTANSTHAASLDVLVSFGNTDRGTPNDGGYNAPTHLANAFELGSVWGLAYQKEAEQLFSSAFLKRHMGFGTLGPGGIYMTDVNAATTVPFVDLSSFGYNFGSITGRNLPIIASEANRDSLAFTLIGEIGMGDLDLSDDGETLWTINLFSKELMSVDISSYLANGSTPVAGDVDAFPIPDPGCSNGDYRPFGLGFYHGFLYIGVVCSAETSQNQNDLRAIVYKVNPNSVDFAEVLNIPLDYQKGGVHNKAGVNCQEFYPWTDIYDDVFFYEYRFGSSCYPQPMLTDIEFDVDGSMILGFCDRYGHQSGGANYSVGDSQPVGYPDPAFADPGVDITSTNNIANPPLFDGQVGGDILRAFYEPLTNTYTLENNGNGGCGAGNGQGPGGGEFYCAETFTSNHEETALGGLAHIPGSNQLVASVMDPLRIISGGLVWLDNTDGDATNSDRYELYRSDRGDPTSFSKAAGLGDIAAFCNPAPLEIGNYVWCDSLQNGIQDACERPIGSINVSLYDRNGNLVGVTQSSASGHYYFNESNVDTSGVSPLGVPNTAFTGLSNSTRYFLVFGEGQFAAGEFNAGGETYGITSVANAGANDKIDSDVDGASLTSGGLGSRPDGLPFIDLTTGEIGCGDHKFDLGLRCTTCMLTDAVKTAEMCNDNGSDTDPADDYISFSLNPAGSGTGLTYSVTVNNGGTVTLLAGGTATGISYGSPVMFRLQDGSADNTMYTVTVTDDTDPTCQITTTVMQDICSLTPILYSLGNRVFYDDDLDGLQGSGENGVAGIILQLLNGDGSIYDGDPVTPGVQALTVTTGSQGYYRFDDLPEGSYIVEIPSPAFISGGILEYYSSSDGPGEELTPNSDIDMNDNGLNSSPTGTIRSGIVTLGGMEPTGETEPGAYEPGSFSGTAAGDTESNLTVDFGFYRQRDKTDCCDPNRPPCTEEPCHFISNEIYLGSGVTADSGNINSGTADSDVDDGILIDQNMQIVPGNVVNIPVVFYNNTGLDAYIRSWIDWNDDGDFDDSGEQIADLLYPAATFTGAFTELVPITIPVDATQNVDLAIRWRISTDDVNTSGPCGTGNCANDGEIEDYLLRVNCPTGICPTVTLTIR